MTDRDVADMFLNYQLHHSVVPFTGINLAPSYEKGEKPEPRWAYWDHNLMGFACSPYNSIKMALIVEEVVKAPIIKLDLETTARNSILSIGSE